MDKPFTQFLHRVLLKKMKVIKVKKAVITVADKSNALAINSLQEPCVRLSTRRAQLFTLLFVALLGGGPLRGATTRPPTGFAFEHLVPEFASCGGPQRGPAIGPLWGTSSPEGDGSFAAASTSGDDVPFGDHNLPPPLGAATCLLSTKGCFGGPR